MIGSSRILTIQRRSKELGRIRTGQVTQTGKGKARPTKLETFRFTSHSESLVRKVAELYGGEPREWQPQGGGAKQWEVLSDSKRIPILVPPQPVSQAFELWSGGGCQRRCDGERESITDSPCLCGPDPAERLCSPTTRLNVILRDVEGIGLWRLESHGYYAAVELPEVADFLARAGISNLPAFLVLEQRTVKRDGQTRQFMVPGIEVEGITPAQLLSAEQPAMPALDAGPVTPTWDADSILAALPYVGGLDELRELWKQAHAAGAMTPEVSAALSARATALSDVSEGGTARQAETTSEAPDDELSVEEQEALAELTAEDESRGDVDHLWQQILMAVPEDWPTSSVEQVFHERTGTTVRDATAADMAAFIETIR